MPLANVKHLGKKSLLFWQRSNFPCLSLALLSYRPRQFFLSSLFPFRTVGKYYSTRYASIIEVDLHIDIKLLFLTLQKILDSTI